VKRPSRGTVAATLGGVAAAGIAATALIGGPALAEAPAPAPSGSAAAPAAPAPAPSGSAATPAQPEKGAAREEKQQELAKALAAELGIDESKVSAALEKVQTAQREKAQQERSAALKTRLDEAVKAGKLTQAEADAILKASEAGVLGGGGPGGFGGPGGWGHGGRPGR
jgi:hypothetical protein